MKTTDEFKNTIKAYLDKRADEDELFAASYAKEGKTIEECCTYILNTVHKSGCNGFTDEEIFGIAVHYYDEDKIEVGEPINSGRVVVNHVVEITEEEKAEAKENAIKKYQSDCLAEMQRKVVKPAKPKTETLASQSLFDL